MPQRCEGIHEGVAQGCGVSVLFGECVKPHVKHLTCTLKMDKPKYDRDRVLDDMPPVFPIVLIICTIVGAWWYYNT
jgi:uncharacterized protein (DUF983 family)